MRSSYKKLAPYIRQVDERNKQGIEENLLGVSTQKIFIESIANTVGTNFKKYKIVKRKQFTYVPDTSRRGDKIGLAMLDHLDEAIVSQAYTVFEIIDHEELDPEYLMMWFRRPEFDRYARYKSHGSVREIFGWDEMCDVELPIPSIYKQREIVQEYNTIVNRIQLNEQMNQKLEETAQAIYKHWFVDFEFPISAEYATSIGKPELEGKPYKSSGGEMMFCEYLGQDIPINWAAKSLNDFVDNTLGGDWGKAEITGNYTEKVKCIRGTDIPSLKKGIDTGAPIRFILGKNINSRKIEPYELVIEISGGSPVQSTGRVWLATPDFLDFHENDTYICSNFCRRVKLKKNQRAYTFYCHLVYLYDLGRMFIYENSTTGVKNFNISSFLNSEFIVVDDNGLITENFNRLYADLTKIMFSNGMQKQILVENYNTLLSRLIIGQNKENMEAA